MIKIGITGSIASGKSTVAKMLARKKYPIFNADNEVKNIYRNKLFQKKIFKKLGVKTKNDIKKIVRRNPKKLRITEKIIHPLVRKNLKLFIKRNERKKHLIFEIPLLIESNLMKKFDVIIFVHAKKKNRIRRFIKKGKNKKLFDVLDRRQLKPNKKMKFCDFLINNNFSLKKLLKNVNILREKLWKKSF